jgi:hypothetical protein
MKPSPLSWKLRHSSPLLDLLDFAAQLAGIAEDLEFLAGSRSCRRQW